MSASMALAKAPRSARDPRAVSGDSPEKIWEDSRQWIGIARASHVAPQFGEPPDCARESRALPGHFTSRVDWA